MNEWMDAYKKRKIRAQMFYFNNFMGTFFFSSGAFPTTAPTTLNEKMFGLRLICGWNG